MEKINIAELLKDCPKGMELYSPIFGKVYLDKIRPHLAIVVITDKEQGDFREEFLYDGRYGMNGECMLFPSKGKTTWEGFVPPCKFKDGDVVYIKTKGYNHNEFIIIFKEIKNDHIHKHACFAYQVLYTCKNAVCHLVDVEIMRLATEEEKAKLFKEIKDNGYKWNTETKTLEKLIKPKFKVGDRIRHKCPEFRGERIIANCDDTGYFTTINDWFSISHQDDWELVPNKFDITTLKPFESRVLIRDRAIDKWCPAIWGFYDSDRQDYQYRLVGVIARYCIPYEGNEHLLGKTADCDEFYKTWE